MSIGFASTVVVRCLVVLPDIVAPIVRKGVKPESLVLAARRIVCARMVVFVIQWMGRVHVLVTGLVYTAINVRLCLFVC